ncbi:MAG: hypothetical protein QOH68_1928 [Nocardioidaceae bacterium]|nr:hypothetical protein [Nocardioidaceae bacterium]
MSTETMPRTSMNDFLRYLSTGEDPHGLISVDCVAQMNFPHTSFTLDSKAAFDELRAGVSHEPWVLTVSSVDPTPDGFVAVIDIDTVAHDGSGVESSRTVTIVRFDGDQITQLSHWCTGQLP